MWSNAPTPSIETNVLRPSSSVSALTMRETQSVPAFVERANWNGEQASSKSSAYCWASVRATPLRKVSPATIPLTRPSSLLRAVKQPSRRASTISFGTSPSASFLPANMRSSVSPSSSKRIFKCSLVSPARPPLFPRGALRRLFA